MKDNDNILRKSFFSSILFIIIVIVVFYFIFKDNNYKEVYRILVSTNKFYLLVAVLCMSFFSASEALNIKITLNTLGENVTFKSCYKYSLAGFFVSGITPSSTGGDPMQLYLMNKDKIKISHGALALLLKLLSYQAVLFILALIGFISCHKIFMTSLGNLKYIIFIGASLNILVGTLYFLIIFCKPVIKHLVNLISKLLHKLRIKKADSIVEKIDVQVEEYSKASIVIKKHPNVLVKIFILTLLELILYYCIPYFVYLSLGYNSHSVFTFISLQSVLFISVSSLPFPGAVGVSEATFMRIYKTLFPSVVLGSAMVITRFINFYIFIFYSGFVLIYTVLRYNKKR